jgi:hypothetical protein
MSDQAPLSTSFDTTQVKTGKPIIVDGWQGKVRFAKCSENELTGKGKVITFEFHLLTPAPTTEGKQVVPPFPLFGKVFLFGKDGEQAVMERALTQICRIQDAFLGTGDPGNSKGKPQRPAFDTQCVADMTGKECYVKVKANVGGEFEGNDITKYTALADMTA